MGIDLGSTELTTAPSRFGALGVFSGLGILYGLIVLGISIYVLIILVKFLKRGIAAFDIYINKNK